MKLMHLTSSIMERGDKLEPQEDGYCHLPESIALEEILERYRPDGKIARKDSIYLFKNKSLASNHDYGAAGSNYVLVVECEDSVSDQKSDMNWLSELDQGFDDVRILEEDFTEIELRELAEGYWSGLARYGENEAIYEYRASEAVVSSVYENSVQVCRKNSKLDSRHILS